MNRRHKERREREKVKCTIDNKQSADITDRQYHITRYNA